MTDKLNLTDDKLAEWEALAKAATPGLTDRSGPTVGELLALAREGLPSAIAEIHRLRGERDEAVGLLDELADQAEIAMRSEGGEGFWAVENARAFLAKLEERG